MLYDSDFDLKNTWKRINLYKKDSFIEFFNLFVIDASITIYQNIIHC